jgi:type VI secretion system protein ImpH
MGRTPDPVGFLDALRREPWAFDFFQALRRFEALHPDKPRLGEALRPADEPIRLGQEASLGFAPASLSAFEPATDHVPARLLVRFLGLLGPNGPLPLHLTEYVRQRLRQGDTTFSRFLDLFHHRLLTLFFRAWAQGQPTVSLDRPRDDRFSQYMGASIGLGMPALRNRDSVLDFAKLHWAGLLARHVRNAEGLRAILCGYFHVPIHVEQFAGHWMLLPETERSRLGMRGCALGQDAVIGAQVYDRQHKIRVRAGPLSLAQYESFLPGGEQLRKLVDWIRFYLGFELAWDVQLVLERSEVPASRLGGSQRLGWSAWLGTRRADQDADDLALDAEAVLVRFEEQPVTDAAAS